MRTRDKLATDRIAQTRYTAPGVNQEEGKMTDIRVPFRSLTTAAAILFALAACEPQSGGTPTASSKSNTGSQPASSSTDLGNSQVKLAQCQTPSNGQVYFQFGQSTMQVPAGMIGDVIPSNMRPPFKREEVQAELQKQAAGGAGCPEKPISASLLLMKGNLGHPLLEGTVGVVNTPPKAAAQRFAQLTAQLQAKPNRNCKTIGGELLACVGTETRGEVDTPVMYVITTDTSQKMQSGGPLAVRCLLEGQKIAGCNIVDHLPGGITFDATLNAGDYSTEGLRGARDAVASRLQAMRQR